MSNLAINLIINAVNNAGRSLAGIGLAISGIEQALGVARSAIGATIGTAANFESAMSQAFAVLGESSGEAKEQLTQLALEMGSKTAFSASQAAEAIEQLGSAGLEASQIIGGGLEGALNLAAASGLKDLGEAARIATGAMNAFGLEASQIEDVADVIAAAANSSNLTVNGFAQSLQSGASVAKAFGLDLRDFAAVMGLAADNMISGSDAGTALKSALMNAANPAEKTAKVMAELGFSIYNTNGSMKSLDQIVANAQTSFASLTDEQRNQAAAMIFGSDGIRIFNLLLKEGTAGLAARKAALMDQEAAERAAAERLNNYAGAQEALKGALETLSITVGRAFLPALTAATRQASEFVGGLNVLATAILGNERAAATLSERYPQLAAVFGFLQNAIIAITPIVQDVRATLEAAFGQAIPSVVAALGPVLANLRAAFAAAGELVSSIWSGTIKPALIAIGPVVANAVGPALVRFSELFRAAFEGAKLLWENALRPALVAIAPLAKQVFDGVVLIVRSFAGTLEAAFDLAKRAWETKLRPAFQAIQPLVVGVFGAVQALIGAATRVISGLLDTLAAFLRGDFAAAWQSIKGLVGAVWQGVIGTLQALIPALMQVGRNLMDGLTMGIRARIDDAISAVTGLGQNIIGSLKRVLGIASPSRAMMEVGRYIVEGVAVGMGNLDPVLRQAVILRRALEEATAGGDIDRVNQLNAAIDAFKRTTPGAAAAIKTVDAATRQYGESLEETRRRIEAWQANLERIAFDRWQNGLQNASDAQLANARAQAVATKNVEAFNAIAAEQERRLQSIADKARAAAEASERLFNDAVQVANRRYNDGLEVTLALVQRSFGQFNDYEDALAKITQAQEAWGVVVTMSLAEYERLKELYPKAVVEIDLATIATERHRDGIDVLNRSIGASISGLLGYVDVFKIARASIQTEAAGLASGATAILGALDDAFKNLSSGIDELAAQFRLGGVDAERYRQSLEGVIERLSALAEAAKREGRWVLAENILRLAQQLASELPTVASLTRATLEAASATANLAGVARDAATPLADVIAVYKSMAAAVERVGTVTRETALSLDVVGRSAAVANVPLAETAATARDLVPSLEGAGVAGRALAPSLEAVAAGASTAALATEQVAAAAETSGLSFKEATPRARALADAIQGLGVVATDASGYLGIFADLGVDGADGVASLADGVAKLIGGDIIGGISAILKPYSELLTDVLAPLAPLFNKLLDALEPLIKPLVELAVTALVPLLEIVVSILTPAFRFLGDLIGGVVVFVRNIINGFIDAYNATLGRIFGSIPRVGEPNPSNNTSPGQGTNPNPPKSTKPPMPAQPLSVRMVAAGGAGNEYGVAAVLASMQPTLEGLLAAVPQFATSAASMRDATDQLLDAALLQHDAATRFDRAVARFMQPERISWVGVRG